MTRPSLLAAADIVPHLMLPEPVVAYEHTFDALYGLQVLEVTDELARGRVEVRRLRAPADGPRARRRVRLDGRVADLDGHGDGRVRRGRTAQGLSNQTSFLRPILSGAIHAEARRRHRGRTTWVWEVDITDDDGRLCALVRMTIAVRDRT